MALIKVNPNRMEVLRLKKRLALAVRGHKLLKQKQDELMRILNDLIQEAKTLRDEVETRLSNAYMIFSLARAWLGDEVIEDIMAFLGVKTELETESKRLLNLSVPVFRAKVSGDIHNYGFLETNSDLDEALTLFYDVIPRIVKLCEVETQLSVVSDEIEKTRRRVNALEYVLIPQLQSTIKEIVMKLEELERASRVRLMKVKEMVR